MALHIAYNAEGDGFYPFQDRTEDLIPPQPQPQPQPASADPAATAASSDDKCQHYEVLLREKDQAIQSLQETITQQQCELTQWRMKVAAAKDNTKILEDMIDAKDVVIADLQGKVEQLTADSRLADSRLQKMNNNDSNTQASPSLQLSQDPLAFLTFSPPPPPPPPTSVNYSHSETASEAHPHHYQTGDGSPSEVKNSILLSPTAAETSHHDSASLTSPPFNGGGMTSTPTSTLTSPSVGKSLNDGVGNGDSSDLDTKSLSQLSKFFLKSLGLTPLAQLPVDSTIAKRVKEKQRASSSTTTTNKSKRSSQQIDAKPNRSTSLSPTAAVVSPREVKVEKESKGLFEAKEFLRAVQPLYIIYKQDSNALQVMNEVVSHVARQLLNLTSEDADLLCKELTQQ